MIIIFQSQYQKIQNPSLKEIFFSHLKIDFLGCTLRARGQRYVCLSFVFRLLSKYLKDFDSVFACFIDHLQFSFCHFLKTLYRKLMFNTTLDESDDKSSRKEKNLSSKSNSGSTNKLLTLGLASQVNISFTFQPKKNCYIKKLKSN